MTLQQIRGYLFLRWATALLLIIHGVTRLAQGTVGDFGGFLSSKGFPLGAALAWSITVYEIGGGLLLAAGRFVRPLAVAFALELAMGIVLVHAQEGWFVVGAGRNGVEYSVLLICAFLAVALLHPRQDAAS